MRHLPKERKLGKANSGGNGRPRTIGMEIRRRIRIGAKFGALTVVKHWKYRGQTICNCRCDCGREDNFNALRLLQRRATHCKGKAAEACAAWRRKRGPKSYAEQGLSKFSGKDFTGVKFGLWTILGRAPKGRWLGRCWCGKEESHLAAVYFRDYRLACKDCLKKISRIGYPRFEAWRQSLHASGGSAAGGGVLMWGGGLVGGSSAGLR